MGFEAVRFFNFRNLLDRELPLGAKQVFLVGENGQGKTNLLEVIHLLAFASSFREGRDSVLPRALGEEVALDGLFRGPAGNSSLSLRVPPGGKKEIRVNGKLLAERRELLGRVLCIPFVQQDMRLVDGPPEARRRFFDQSLVLSEPAYLEVLRDYKRVLRSRNFALKSRQADLLDVYDRQLAPLGLQLTARRSALVREFNAVFSPLHQGIAEGDQAVEIRYRPSWRTLSDEQQVKDVLASSRGRDLGLGTTTSGPHRDAFSYACCGIDYARYASTGQLRLCALALRVAQACFLAERTARKPVLLLDDVLLELDPGKKRSFISRFPPYEQAFFTFLPDEDYLQYRGEDALLLSVKAGRFEK